ncbi:MAG: hypothetical protein V3U75_04265 [Methylococcaceae bacterium]
MDTDRRTFMQRCLAVVGGVVAAFVPGKKIVASGYPGSHSPSISPRKPKECEERKSFTVTIRERARTFKTEPSKKPPDCLKPITPKFSNVCYCRKQGKIVIGDTVMCNFPKCSDYNPGNEKPYKEFYE